MLKDGAAPGRQTRQNGVESIAAWNPAMLGRGGERER